MKEQRFLNVLGQVDEAYIEEAAPGAQRSGERKNGWAKWAALAACLCLAVLGAVGAIQRAAQSPKEPRPVPGTASGFQLQDAEHLIVYSQPGFGDVERFHLLYDESAGVTPENIYRPTEQDLGAFMGTVGASEDTSLIGHSVYHFARYPASDAICILERDGEYIFYVADGIGVDESVGQKSNVQLEAYGMPDAISKVELLDPGGDVLHEITDRETFAALTAILSNKENIGRAALDRLCAQLWNDTYGNDDVYYSEVSGEMHFKDETARSAEAELVNKDDCLLQVTTEEGFWFHLQYKPALSLIMWGELFYPLTEEDVSAMDELLSPYK